eukprot:14759828-Alexandrium_andersonii.AAC.1
MSRRKWEGNLVDAPDDAGRVLPGPEQGAVAGVSEGVASTGCPGLECNGAWRRRPRAPSDFARCISNVL